MTQDDSSSRSEQGEPGKKGLNLDLLFRPATAVPTSVGTLYLYGLRTSDLSAWETLPGEEPIARIRAFVPHIASLVEATGFKDERLPLAAEDVDRLSDAEMEHVAEVYAETLLRGPRIDGEESAKPERENAEPAAAYLDRLLKHEAQEQSQQLRRVREKMVASTSSIFDQVRRSSATLGSTLSAFEQLTKSSPTVEIRSPSMDHFHAMNEHFARQARERAEELEMVRLTGKMTAESAKTLKDLAEAATVLLEQLDERDKRADRSTRKQITIAVWSVGISAVLALFALIVSGLAYLQDKDNNAAGDKWQTELIATVRDGSHQRDTNEKEAQRLRDQVAELEAKIARIESAQAAASPGKSADSAARRATNPGSTLPPL
ncbi:hypothetical protein ACUHOQ_001268 [Pseudomonas aeruginosa]|uniref:hypothetical protein n=1 Tax=Pseudomonas aeruginosa TaxID=287 RepID=UPI001596C0BD|nr:hypothetical protein [Pseudomonas aeruginosa]EKY1809571.1 hypothetical protein [Pseudomonas aeruginosa]MBI6969215.1 hypothetical protein [Pseudomonas aeruginosa]MBV5917951.1 hypothetical protein [Pseudomonas aeruginosa]MBX6224679.1 hypothetical protein [Pseudomonas aeruginosa]HBO0852278.1 hypothetical protein [Pseudomonas aeruginosa]